MKRWLQVALLGCIAVASAAAAEVPRKAPEFTIKMPKGDPVYLSQYRGKVVALEFLFTTCPHCQHASQLMSRLQTEYGPKGFQAVGVAFNDMSHMLVPDFVRDYKVNYPVGYSSREAVYGFLQGDSSQAIHVPQLVYIDRKGVIRHQSLPQNDGTSASEGFMRQTIENLLKETAAAPAKAGAKKAARKAS